MENSVLNIFCSYSHKDEKYLVRLREFLVSIERNGLAVFWHDGKIPIGSEWEKSILDQLNNADVIIMLISQSFIASGYCYDIEMRKAIERHNNKEVVVIPVMLEFCVWNNEPFAGLEMVPKDAKPIENWGNQNEAYKDAAHKIIQKIESISEAKNGQHKLDVKSGEITELNIINEFLAKNNDLELSSLMKSYLNVKKIDNQLYSNVLGGWIDDFVKKVDVWTSGDIVMTPEETLAKGELIFEKLKKGGFATYFAPMSDFWNDESKTYNLAARKAARRGCDITRVFILRDFRILFSDDFRLHIQEDINAGFIVQMAFYLDIQPFARQDFGIWDDEVLCTVHTRVSDSTQKEEPINGTLKIEKKDLDEAKRWKNEILMHSFDASKIIEMIEKLDMHKIHIMKSMPEMERFAQDKCESSYIDENDCRWYHSSWQYLRLLGLVSTPFWHYDFYNSQIEMFRSSSKSVKVGEQKQILVSGTADYAILQILYEVLKGSRNFHIEIVDRCETPLEICKWYNANIIGKSLTINTSRRDIRKTGYQNEDYDLIITDAFLTRFSDGEKTKVVDEWIRILKPGGKIVTTVRIERNIDNRPLGAKRYESENFMLRAAENIKQYSPLLDRLSKGIIDKAHDYATRMISYSFKSDQQIKELFKGLKLEMFEKETAGEFNSNTTYMQIVATKPS